MEYSLECMPITEICLNVTEACNLACKYCLTGDTKIILADGTIKQIQDVQVGDVIWGCEEETPGGRKQRSIIESQVLEVMSRSVDSILEIELQDGKVLHITDEHPILNGRGKWTQAKNLRETTSMIMSIGTIPDSQADITYHPDYIKGYFIGMWMTDGSYKAYKYEDSGDMYRMRLAVKDDEIIERMQKYCDTMEFDYTIRDFKISEKENLMKPALFSSKSNNYQLLAQLEEEIEQDSQNPEYLRGFVAACYDAEGHIGKDGYTLSISNSSPIVLDTWEKGLNYFGFKYKRDNPKIATNLPVSRSRLIVQGKPTGSEQIRFFNIFCPAVKRKTYQVFIDSHLYFRNSIKSIKKLYGNYTVYNLETSTHTYLANGCVVHNCFTEHHPNFITLDVAKDTARWLHENAKIASEIREEEVIPNIGFFGGEPTLMWDSIIVPLVNWIDEQGWKFTYGITTNCTLLNKERVDFAKEHGMGVLISIDGAEYSQNCNRPCKDKSKKSYDMIMENLPYIQENYPWSTFRITITAETADRLFENLMFAGEMGFEHVFAIINEFEEWPEEARKLVEIEMLKYSLYVIDACRCEQPFVKMRPWEQAINKIVALNTVVAAYDGEDIPEVGPEEMTKCGLGGGYGSVNYKGDIFSCQEVASREGEKSRFYIGNIYDGIDEERLSSLRNDFVNRPIKTYNYEHPEKCATCGLRKACRANLCQVNNYILHKDFGANPDCWCWWNNLMKDSAQMVMEILGYHKNEFFRDYLKEELTNPGGPFAYAK